MTDPLGLTWDMDDNELAEFCGMGEEGGMSDLIDCGTVSEQVPQEAGLYLAKTGNYQWWNMIVFVRGKPPFLKAWSCDRVTGELPKWGELDVSFVTEWSERICE